MARLWRKLMFLIRRERFDRDLEDEMRFHLDMKARAGGGTAEADYVGVRSTAWRKICAMACGCS
jgi:hypothetical protein